MRTCSGCQQTKPLEDFKKLSKGADGRATRCKRCAADYMNAYYKANPEPIKARTANYFSKNRDDLNLKRKIFRQQNLERENESVKIWAKNNPEKTRHFKARNRAKRNQAKVFSVTKKDITRLAQSLCFYCGAKAQHIDHVIPLARGGTHGIGNLVSACRRCNLQKSSKTIMEWRLWKIRVLGC